MTYGYRFRELGLLPGNVNTNVKIIVNSAIDPMKRTPAMESLGCHVLGATPIHPDHNDQNSMIAGGLKRIARQVPTPKNEELEGLRAFTRKFLKENVAKLDPCADISVATWLASTNYPEWRRKELEKVWEDCGMVLSKKDYNCKCFMKDETYTEFKLPRGIFSRSDAWKCFMGPITKLIEEKIYALPWFIKHIPVPYRPEYIARMIYIPGAIYVATDYTAFEASFVKEVMEVCEFELYEHCASEVRGGAEWLREVKKTLGGLNHCQFKRFNLNIPATRMSGEMSTSLGNGFTNLMVMLYLCSKLGSTCVGVVEGDDGLFRIDGEIPSSKDFEDLGFTIKLEKHTELNKASFCGLVFDVDDKINVSCPREILLNFGWSKTPYVRARKSRKMELLRSKSLSFAHQYKGCPIIQSMAHYGLRMTKHVDIMRYLNKERSISMWEREQLLMALRAPIIKTDVPVKTRLLMQDTFGVPIDMQIRIETYFDNLDSLVPWMDNDIYLLMDDSSKLMSSMYTCHDQGDHPKLNVADYDGALGKFSEFIKFSRNALSSGVQYLVF